MSHDDPSSRVKHGTAPGFGPLAHELPQRAVRALDALDAPIPVDAGLRVPEQGRPGVPEVDRRGPPAVDIDLVHERRSAPILEQPWVFLEIWTRNTIYQLDGTFTCIDVVDQASRRSQADHPLRGSRLVGGQSRDGERVELSHPFPRPGSEAVFEQVGSGKAARFSQTSTVTRVVMRLRVLTVEPDKLIPTWEDVSGSWDQRALMARRK